MDTVHWSCLHIYTCEIFLLLYLFTYSLQCFDTGWLGGRKGIWPVKTEWWVAGMVICLARDADLHMAQLMPLPLTVSCFSEIQIGFTFLVPANPGSPRKRAVKRMCVCVCVSYCSIVCLIAAYYCSILLQHQWMQQYKTKKLKYASC